MSDYHELLIGCGRDRRKRWCALPHHPLDWQGTRIDGKRGPITLDVNPKVKPDLWCDLNAHPPWYAQAFEPVYGGMDRDTATNGWELHAPAALATGVFYELLPDYWDEIHAYHVLEHLGRQGDALSFLRQFQELWRLLKPGGYLVAEVPSRFSEGLWGDPGHTRAIVSMSLTYLDQLQYQRQCDAGKDHTGMTDYRDLYKGDFRIVQSAETRERFVFVLQAVKPARGMP